MLLVVCMLVVSVAQEGFKITGQLGGTLSGDLVLVENDTAGLVKLDETLMVDGSFEFVGRVDGGTTTGGDVNAREFGVRDLGGRKLN